MTPERNISLGTPMVQAQRAGRKSMTRRIVSFPQTWEASLIKSFVRAYWIDENVVGWWFSNKADDAGGKLGCPYGKPGDILRVREAAWMWCEKVPDGKTPTGRPKFRYVPMREAPIHYKADRAKIPLVQCVSPDTGNPWGWRLKIPRFLPAWAVRTRLRITSIRVERLQDITEEDAIAEGIERHYSQEYPDQTWWKLYNVDIAHLNPVESYRTLWESINGTGSWERNDWAWVISFEPA